MLLRIKKQIAVSLVACLLSQCASVTKQPHIPFTHQPLASPYTMSATAYLALAQNQADSERQSLLIMAAGRYIYDGQWREGLNILSQTGTLSETLADEKQLLLAKVDLIREQSRLAISKLAQVHHIETLPIYYQAQYHEMLATAYQATGNSVESISERIKLDALLPDEISKSNNRRALWLSLTSLPQEELDTLSLEAKVGSVLQGWLTLTAISRQTHDHPGQLLAQIERWQQQYPVHPANSILPNPLNSVKEKLYKSPHHIALLLPQSGPLSGPGKAIKDGFSAALASGSRAKNTTLSVYDTNGMDVVALYQKAIHEGAEFIIGPLSKTDVAKIAGLTHPVPTLLLNDLEHNVSDNAYQFGLSPNNEAKQVAVKARKHGYAHALIIAPDGTWGDDVANSFANQWRSGGGRVVDTLRYGTNDDLTTKIRDFLHINARDMKSKPVKRIPGQPHVATVPNHRQDFDVIFLLAYPSKARQIVPLLKYYYVGNTPVYATSTVYAGSIDTQKDRDLDGVIFCDMPWVFTHQAGNKHWPEPLNSYNRLYALGLDSYALTSQLNQLLLFPALGVHDKTGILYLTPMQQIARIARWGQFKQGVAQPLYDNNY